jgi:hypothetical protein
VTALPRGIKTSEGVKGDKVGLCAVEITSMRRSALVDYTEPEDVVEHLFLVAEEGFKALCNRRGTQFIWSNSH